MVEKVRPTDGVEALLVRNEELQHRIKLLEKTIEQLNLQVDLWKQKAEKWEERTLEALNIK